MCVCVCLTVSSIMHKKAVTATAHACLKVRAPSTRYEKHSTWWGIKSSRCRWVALSVIGIESMCRLQTTAVLNIYNYWWKLTVVNATQLFSSMRLWTIICIWWLSYWSNVLDVIYNVWTKVDFVSLSYSMYTGTVVPSCWNNWQTCKTLIFCSRVMSVSGLAA